MWSRRIGFSMTQALPVQWWTFQQIRTTSRNARSWHLGFITETCSRYTSQHRPQNRVTQGRRHQVLGGCSFSTHPANQEHLAMYANSDSSTRPKINRDDRRRNFKIIHLCRSGKWRKLEHLFWNQRDLWNVVNLTTMLHHLNDSYNSNSSKSTSQDTEPKNPKVSDRLLTEVTRQLEWFRDELDIRHLGVLRRSISTLNLSPTIEKKWKSILADQETKLLFTSTSKPSPPESKTMPRPPQPKMSISAAREINSEIIHLGKQQDWDGILRLCEEKGFQFNPVNMSTAMTQLTKLALSTRNINLQEDTRVKIFLAHVADRLNSDPAAWEPRSLVNVVYSIAKMQLSTEEATTVAKKILGDAFVKDVLEKGNSQDFSNLAWAAAKLGSRTPLLFHFVNKNSDDIVREGTTQAIANMAWAAASLDEKCPNLFRSINQNIQDFVAQAEPQHITNVAWACAVNEVPDCPRLFREINARSQWLVSKANTQEIANTVWAVGKLNMKGCDDLFWHVDGMATQFVERARPQEVANTAWAFAALGFEGRQLFEAIERNSERILAEGTSQNIANIAWASAVLDHASTDFFKALNRRSSEIFENANAQEMSNIAWSAAKLEHKKLNRLFYQLESRVDVLFSDGRKSCPQELANVIWAFGHLGLYSPRLLEAIDQNAESIMFHEGSSGKLDVHATASIAVSLAQLGHASKTFLDLLHDHADHIANNGTPQQIANVCYALAIIDNCSDMVNFKTLQKLWERATALPPRELGQEGGIQLLQTYYMMPDLKRPEAFWQSEPVSLSLIESSAQAEMSSLLQELGVTHESEYSPLPSDCPAKGLLAVDAALPEQRIAIEFHGPHHFLRHVRNGKTIHNMEKGPTQAKRVYLEKNGWKVIHISFIDWNKARTREERKRLLSNHLK